MTSNKIRKHEFASKTMVLTFSISLLLMLSLIGCGTGSAIDFKKNSGTEGLVISFMKDAPPKNVYENGPFPVRVEIHNKGAQDVNYSNMRITFTDDPLYITGGISPYDPRIYDQGSSGIKGRSLAYRDGEKKMYAIPSDSSFYTKPVYGQRASPTTDLTASVCYAYTTSFSTDVCIDSSIYGQNQRAQSCTQKDLKFSGGQGAPIAITNIEVRAVPVYDRQTETEAVRPEFYIELQNVGKGYLISPNNQASFENACLLKGIASGEANGVKVEAWLLNTKLTCGTPTVKSEGIVQLLDGKGYITCTVPPDQMSQAIYSATQNFQTILTMNVSYIYKSSIKQSIVITRKPGNEETNYPLWMYGKRSGFMYMSDVKGSLPNGFMEGPKPEVPAGTQADASGNAPKAETPVYNIKNQPATKCEYYSADPSQAPTAAKQITASFSCSCGKEQCITLGAKGQCIYGFCPGDTYCCNNAGVPNTIPSVSSNSNIQSTLKNINSYSGLMNTIEQAAKENGIDAKLMVAVIAQESKGDAKAVSATGCVGIAQFCSATAKDYSSIFGSGIHSCSSPSDCSQYPADPRFDPYKSVKAEAKLLKANLNTFNKYSARTEFAVGAYNSGPGAIQEAIRKTGQSDPSWNEVSQYVRAEGQNYVPAVMSYYAALGTT